MRPKSALRESRPESKSVMCTSIAVNLRSYPSQHYSFRMVLESRRLFQGKSSSDKCLAMDFLFGSCSIQSHLPSAHERNRHFALAIDSIEIVLVISSRLVRLAAVGKETRPLFPKDGYSRFGGQ